MTQDKLRKVISACVSAATVLLVVLVAFLCYQWITLAVLDKREKNIKADNAHWEEKIAEAEDYLSFAESDLFLEWKAFELGFVKGN